MGALISFDLKFRDEAKSDETLGSDVLRLFAKRWLLRTLVYPFGLRRKRAHSPFEYSLATSFPYNVDGTFGGTRLQLALAAAGEVLMPLLRRRRAAYLRKIRKVHRITGVLVDAPYIIVSSAKGLSHRAKPSYAKHGTPQLSIRPSLHIIHYKGFDDKEFSSSSRGYRLSARSR